MYELQGVPNRGPWVLGCCFRGSLGFEMIQAEINDKYQIQLYRTCTFYIWNYSLSRYHRCIDDFCTFFCELTDESPMASL